MAERPNIHTPAWEREFEHGPFALRGARVGAAAGAQRLGLGVFELAPGRRNLPYHLHFGIEELLVVLRGTPVLRSPQGERELAEGEVVCFPPGREGAHQLINRGEAPVRFLIASSTSDADLVEYPDSGKISAQGGRWGTAEAASYMLSTEHQLGYFDGEAE